MICDDSKSRRATLSSVLLAKAKGGCVFETVEEEFGSLFLEYREGREGNLNQLQPFQVRNNTAIQPLLTPILKTFKQLFSINENKDHKDHTNAKWEI